MKEYIKKNGLRLLIAVIILALIVVLASSLLKGRAGPIKDAAGGLSAPVSRAAASAIEWIEGIYGYIYEYDQLVAENNALRAELAELRQSSLEAVELREENERLRTLLDFSQKHEDFVYESAKITAWSDSNWSSTFTISKGTDNADTPIEVGDCVVTEYGALVGQIIEVGSSWSTVRTVIDSSIDVGALVGEAGSVGMCVGDFALMQEGCLKLTYLSENAQLVEGEAVLTSGKGTYIPQNLIIGYIRSVLSEASGQTLYGVVEPACDLDRLTQVFVITDFTIQE
ncbi:MAG: rod shape-determining protein MreC [Oscillospiraceae bacterium]